jgi:hypothetical protein
MIPKGEDLERVLTLCERAQLIQEPDAFLQQSDLSNQNQAPGLYHAKGQVEVREKSTARSRSNISSGHLSTPFTANKSNNRAKAVEAKLLPPSRSKNVHLCR